MRTITTSEASIHQQVANYLQLQHREVMFRTDFAAGIKMTMGQAIKHKKLQSGRGWPDLFLAAPRGGFHGMFIELKREGRTVWLRTGELAADMREQGLVLDSLRLLGYHAVFAVGFEDAKSKIDSYLAL